MASRFIMPTADVGKGLTPSDGAKLTFFITGTSTPKDTFTTEAATTPNANPVIADSNGVFPDIFITGTYKVTLTDKNDVQSGFGEADPVEELAQVATTPTIAGNDKRYAPIFATVAAMIAASPVSVDGTVVNIVAGMDVETQGRLAAGDGGGGQYFIKTSVQFGGTPDEKGDHTLDSGDIAVLNIQDEIFVDQFGAVGDGVADDSAAIQAALDRGIPVRFAGKDYAIAQQIDYEGNTMRGIGVWANISPEPALRTRFICTATPAANPLGELVVFNRTIRVANGIVSDITFIGDTANTCFGSQTAAIAWQRVFFERCNFRDFKRGCSVFEAVVVTFDFCRWFNCTDRGVHFEATFNQAVKFTNCFGSGSTDSGGYIVFFQSDSQFKNNNVTFDTCAFDDSDSGVFVKNARATFINTGLENHQVDFIKTDQAEVTVLNPHYLSFDTGSGTGTAYNITNNSQIFEVSGRYVNNFIDRINLDATSTFLTTGALQTDVTIASGGKYGTLQSESDVLFTPTVLGTSVTGVGTYTTQFGRYQKVGNRLSFSIQLAWSAHTGSGNMRFTLPFTTENTTGLQYVAAAWVEGATFSSAPFVYIPNNSGSGRIYEHVSGSVPIAVNLPSAGSLILTFEIEI